MSMRGSKRAGGARGEEPGTSKRRRTEPDDALWQLRPVSDLKMSSIYNRSASEAPAELFRKDLISAMKLPDSEPLTPSEYWVITDTWKQEWERGVQVPVNPDSLPAPKVKVLKNIFKPNHPIFKLPKDKYIHLCRDANYSSEKHVLSTTPARAETICSYDMDAADIVWLKLLNAERARAGLVAVTEDQFERVIAEMEARTWERIQEIMKSEEGLGIEYDENVICDVCRSPDSEDGNEMVFCDSCNICVHQACYGITVIPDGQWLCRPCGDGVRPTCALCPNLGGALKRTPSGHKWAHVSCVLWIPEVSIGCAEKMEPITQITSIPSSRWSLVCALCRERKGACIQCSVRTCKIAYHVTCAFTHGLEMRAIIEDEMAEEGGVKLRSYCLKHSVNSRNEMYSVGSGSEEEDIKRKRRKDMTSEEKTQARAVRLQEIEREFDKHFCVDDLNTHLLEVDQEAIYYIHNYWKLKRRAGRNRPLVPPKSDDSDLLTHRQEQADLDKMKQFVQLRQDLERVRNLCYMVSRREKLSRSFFRMREQTFHKQIAVLSEETMLSGPDLAAIIEANHGPSIYDRLYSHADAADHKNDFADMLARIAPTDSGDEKKKDRNGMIKGSKVGNPYKKHYVNGSRRSENMYSGLSSEESAPEISRTSKYRGRAIGSSTEDELKKPSCSPKKRVSPKSMKIKKSPRKIERKKKKTPRSKAHVESSSEDEVKPKLETNRSTTLQQMEKEMAASGKVSHSGTDSDELMPMRPKRSKFTVDIYSDSSDDDSWIDMKPEVKGEKIKTEKIKTVKSPSTDSQQPLPRTKAAMKEFVPTQPEKKSPIVLEKPAPKKRGRKPSNKEKKVPPIKTESDEEAKNKENIKFIKQKDNPTDLIVPQRQAAKKASENMRSTTILKKEEPVSSDDKSKPKTKFKGKEAKDIKEPAKIGRKKSKDTVEKEPIAYVPQRQAAKKAAAHIKSGLGSKIPVNETTDADSKKKEDIKIELSPKLSPKKEDVKSTKVSVKESSSSSSSSSSSCSSSSSSEDEPEKPDIKPTAKAREIKPIRQPSLFSPPGPRPTVDLPFLDRVSRPLSSTSASSDSESSKGSGRSGSSSPLLKRPRRRRKGKSFSGDSSPPKAPDKKLKTSERGPECRVPSPIAKREESNRISGPRAATRARTRSTTAVRNMPNKSDSRQRKSSKDEFNFAGHHTTVQSRESNQLSPSKRQENEEIKKEEIEIEPALKTEAKVKNSKSRRRSISLEMKIKSEDSDDEHSDDKKTLNRTVKASPIKTSNIKTSPIKTSPIKTSPIKTSPIKTSPIKTSPSNASPVKLSPAKVSPIKASPSKTSPIKHSPAKVSPVKASPKKPLESKHKSISSRRQSTKEYISKEPVTIAVESTPSAPVKQRRSSVRYDSKHTPEVKSLSPVKEMTVAEPAIDFDRHKSTHMLHDEFVDDKWVPKAESPNVHPPPVEKRGDHEKYMTDDKAFDSDSADKTSIRMIAKIQATLNENTMIKSPKTPLDARSINMEPMDVDSAMTRNVHKRSIMEPDKKYINQDASHVQGVEISKSAKIPSAVNTFQNRSIFSPQSKDNELFDFNMLDDGFNQEIMKPFNSYPEISFFKEDSKEQGVQETMNLVDRLRLQLSSKKPPPDNVPPLEEPIVNNKDRRSEENNISSDSVTTDQDRDQHVPLSSSPKKKSVLDVHDHILPNHEINPVVNHKLHPLVINDLPPREQMCVSNVEPQPVPMTSNEKWSDIPVNQSNAILEPPTDLKSENSMQYSEDFKSNTGQSDIPSVSEIGDTISISKQSDDSQSISVVDHSTPSNDQELSQDNQTYDNNNSMIHSDCATISSPYASQDSKWHESKITTRRSSASSTNSERSVGSQNRELRMHAANVLPEMEYPPLPYSQFPAFRTEPPFLPLFSAAASLFPPPLTFAPPLHKPVFPTLCATFTSSSQNIALTTAMIAPPTPKPMDSPRDDMDKPPPSPTISAGVSGDSFTTESCSLPAQPISVDSGESTTPADTPVSEIKSSPKLTKTTPKFGKSPGKSPGFSPKHSESKGTKRSSNRSNRSQRGRGRSKSRAQGAHSYLGADYVGDSIQSKLVGTVYDFDEEIANDGVELKALRERRKSVEAGSVEAGEELAPVLPGPVDMRNYQPAPPSFSHLLDFAAPDQHHLPEIDEEVEKQLQSALKACKPVSPPHLDPPKVSLSDSRNQLKVKIKGPFLDANYVASSVPLPPATPVGDPAAAPVAGTSTNLRRMRKKELLYQYNQDKNNEPAVAAPPPAAQPPPAPRAVITIPKAVASMTSIPTREDYRATEPAPARRRPAAGASIPRELRMLTADDAGRRRAPRKPPPAPTPTAMTASTPPTAPKLKIKIGANVVQQLPYDDHFRPPKKRLLTTAPKPSLEDLRRDSMKYRRKVMADFEEAEEKRKKYKPNRSEKRKKKKDKKCEKLQVVNSESESATKLIIKIKRTKEEESSASGAGGIGKSEVSSDVVVPVAFEPPVDPFEYDPSAPDPLAIDPPSYSEASAMRKIRTAKVTPIRLKLSRNTAGPGYVMAESETSGARATSPAAAATPAAHASHVQDR